MEVLPFAAGFAVGGVMIVAMTLRLDMIVFVVAIASLGMALVSPRSGLVLLALVMPLISRPILPAPGYPFILVASTLMGCVYRLPFDRPNLTIRPAILPLVGLLVYIGVQQLPVMLTGYAGTEGRDIGSLFFKILTAFGAIIAAAYLVRGRSPTPYLAALFISAALVTIVAVLMFAQGGSAEPLAGLAADGEPGTRPSGSFGNPNYFGAYAAVALVAAAGWAWGAGRSRIVLFPLIGLFAAGVAVSQSRGAFLGVTVGLVVVAFARSRRAGFTALALGAVAVIVLTPILIEWRLTNSRGSADTTAVAILANSDAGRLDAVLNGPRLWATSPFLGIGFAGYRAATGMDSHNWYMAVLAEQGLVGVVLVVLTVAGVAVTLLSRPVTPRSVGTGVLALVVAASLFVEPPRELQSSIMIVLLLTLAVVARWRPGEPGDPVLEAADPATPGADPASAPWVPATTPRRLPT